MTTAAESAAPEVPTGVAGVHSSSEIGTVWVTWTAPHDNNSTITTYEIMYTLTGVTPASEEAVNATGNPASTFFNITGLTTGSGYTFKVRAINDIGPGAWSAESDEVGPTLKRFQCMLGKGLG